MRTTALLILILLVLLVPHRSDAQLPVHPLSFQGILTDTLGNALPTGPHDMRFSVFDAPHGGTELWFEEKNVPTARGAFSVTLGDAKPMVMLDFANILWLGIRVDGMELSPRMQFSATGFSNRAGVADSLTGGRFAHGTVVRSINALTDNIFLAAGPNVAIERSDDTLRISATGGTGPGFSLPYADSTSIGPAAFKVKNTGAGIGVFGASENGNGVQGESTVGNGVTGKSGSTNGVYGLSSSEKGFGMSGRNSSISAWGFVGGQLPTHVDNSGRGRAGLFGECVEAADVYATAIGVAGFATSSVPMGGFAYGVYGRSERNVGVCGSGPDGVWGEGTETGVSGYGDSIGVFGDTRDGTGVWAHAMGAGVAFKCVGDFVQISGSFSASPTTTKWTTNKPATVKLRNGTPVKLFTEEAAEVYFTDYGEGMLTNGRAHIELDPVFLQTVTIDSRHPLKAFVQLEDDCQGVYIAGKTSTGFDVVELKGGSSNAAFTYRVVCKRQYYEDERLATEKEDIQYNTSMLQAAWPEVVAKAEDEKAELNRHRERTRAARPEAIHKTMRMSGK